MKTAAFVLSFITFSGISAQKFETPYEKSGFQQTATYAECRNWYASIQKAFPSVSYFDSMGVSDAGNPIYTFRIYTGRSSKSVRVLINNNIHPGEPEGTDASMLLVRDILTNQNKWKEVLQYVDLHIICQYNVDGTLNRGCCSRANQNGPLEYGFRGTSKNLDLNRDFIKCDSRNTQAFVQYFTENKFNIFIDNHTSNGADYQYTLTWFHTREEKLNPILVPIMKSISTDLSQCLLNEKKIPTAPYVETYKTVPDSGIVAFWESGRYSTGYAALRHCIGFTVETHMFKPFKDRVAVTQAFMEALLKSTATEKMAEAISDAYRKIVGQTRLTGSRTEIINWNLNTKKRDTIEFLGYEHAYIPSAFSGSPRLKYYREKPWKKSIPYYRYYSATDSIQLPRIYFIPHAWANVSQQLSRTGIEIKMLGSDTLMKLRVSYISSCETVKNPYEGHYMHYNTRCTDTTMYIQLKAGDYYIIVNNANRALLAATLEPKAPDSYFNWNYFDEILMQKEWFSDYVFEEKAVELLKNNPNLKKEFEEKKASDSSFAASYQAQLLWIYRHSPYYETTHNRIPVYRMD